MREYAGQALTHLSGAIHASPGVPVFVVMAEPGASLAAELHLLLPELRKTVGDERQVLVGFDRSGCSPRSPTPLTMVN
ncbi:hypothetical protein [Arthrobacter sp. H35-D1]|uniref:hypothetical protein n=1 Tax=Arthrobacter sp. H35-D1 TaxID=3046202 RepID=UPI0024BA2238|nr:hypothetical protein [Arthrobacter sp. H35-D1]MDJ0314783.1 hypothetical protein [Arthrobacter sp. H35-D1]